MITRRSFLARAFSALVAVNLARDLTAAELGPIQTHTAEDFVGDVAIPTHQSPAAYWINEEGAIFCTWEELCLWTGSQPKP